MNLGAIFNRVSKSLADNSSSILTGAAVVGTITTAIFTARATSKAVIDILEARENHDPGVEVREWGTYMPRMESVKLVWKHYVPAASMGVATIACIIGAHTTHSRRHAAILGAYSITEAAFKDYRAKIVETIGESKERRVREDLAKDQLEKNPVEGSQVIITGLGETMCYDTITGRYFKSDIEKIRKAQNDINAKIVNEMHASQNDFYRLIGLPSTGIGEDLGWNLDNRLDIFFSTHLSEDGQPCLSIDYHSSPVRNYWKVF